MERYVLYIGSYRLLLAVVLKTMNFRCCLLRLGPHSVLITGLEKVYMTIRFFKLH